MARSGRGLEQDRAEDRRPGRRLQARPSRPRPAVCSSQTATAPSPRPRLEQPLRRLAALPVEVRAPEAAAEQRFDRLRGQRVGHRRRTRLTLPCNQPPRPPVLPSRQPPRGGRSRTGSSATWTSSARRRDGDGRALDVLVERHAPAREPARGAAHGRPRGGARRRAGVAREAVHAAAAVPRRGPVRDLAPSPRREHLPRPARAPAQSARRSSSRSRTSRPARRAIPRAPRCSPTCAASSPTRSRGCRPSQRLVGRPPRRRSG